MQKTVNLAKFLKEKREHSGLSQKQVSEKLGYSTPQFVSNWERGLAAPPPRALKKLADLYRISVDDIFDTILQSTLQQVTADLKRKVYGRRAY